jgi:hypothetical protein
VAGVGADQVAAGRDQLGSGDAVGGQPVAAGQKAEPAAEGVAGLARHEDPARDGSLSVVRGAAVLGVLIVSFSRIAATQMPRTAMLDAALRSSLRAWLRTG